MKKRFLAIPIIAILIAGLIVSFHVLTVHAVGSGGTPMTCASITLQEIYSCSHTTSFTALLSSENEFFITYCISSSGGSVTALFSAPDGSRLATWRPAKKVGCDHFEIGKLGNPGADLGFNWVKGYYSLRVEWNKIANPQSPLGFGGGWIVFNLMAFNLQ